MKSRLQLTAVIVLLAIVFAAETVGLRSIYTTRNPSGNDLLPRWLATRAWLTQGLSPYDPAIEQRGQGIIYGRPATKPGEDLARFLYLPYAMLFYLPIALLPYSWAQAAWMTAIQFCLMGMTFVAFRLYRWSPPTWLAGLIALWSIVGYPGARSLLLGQLTIVIALLIAVGLWAVRERRDVLAGILFALSTAKPTLAIPLIPIIFIWSLSARRWKLAGALAASLIVLVAFSFLVAPDWPMAVIGQAQGYTAYTEIGSVANIVTRQVFPVLGVAGEYTLSAILVGWMLWEWWRARGNQGRRFEWAVAVTLVVTLIVSPRTGTTSQPVLYLVLIMLFARLARARPRWASAGIVVTLAVTAIGLWALFLITVAGRIEQPPVFLPLPLGLAGALVFARTPDA
ncbi:MAG: DUF2029 domain-containing protein [Chloroflexi bacterium]|nr:DUF2029 domain-containing protein [Chloroflexota bacterium]